MACYILPLSAALLGLVAYRIGKIGGVHAKNFILLFGGGAIFGVVDHLWNGELLLVSSDIASDMLLGIAITVALAFAWSLTVLFSRATIQVDRAESKA
jgi:hypothetical protein